MAIFFLDRNLGRYVVAAALRDAGAEVEIHDDHFPQDAPDEGWLPEVGRRGWAVITKDDRIRYREAETSAARASNVALFIIAGKGMRATAIADVLVAALPKMKRLLETEPRPFIAKITRRSDITLLR
jgi:hypothetical protein